jgi:hypothetical protein
MFDNMQVLAWLLIYCGIMGCNESNLAIIFKVDKRYKIMWWFDESKNDFEQKESEHKQVAKLMNIFCMNVIYLYCIEADWSSQVSKPN